MQLKRTPLRSLIAVGILVLAGCSASTEGPGTDPGSGGSTATGGSATTSGGASNGGAVTMGGTMSGGSSNGGTVSNGGATTSGGALTTSGGNVATSGGSTASGGSSTNGGTSNGGTTASGGANSGGTMSKGGASASGGVSTSGGKAGGGGTSGSGGITSTGGAGGSAGATFHVFLLLGQSNMEGYPKAQQADRAEDPRIKVLGYDDCAKTGRQKDQWDIAAPPLHSCWNDGLGPGDYFAKTLLPKLPANDTIGLVPCAINGEKIETFLKVGGSKYAWIVQRAKLAQQAGGVIKGILFHQGESNNQDSSWPGKVNTLVKDLKTDLGLGDVPFLAGELLYGGGCAAHNPLINQLPSVVSNAFVISASGLVEDPADTTYNLHFDHDSQVTFGKRYAEKMITALGL